MLLTGFTTVSAQEEILIDYYDYLNNDSSVQLINIGDMTGQALTLNNTTYITKISVLAGKQFGTFNYSGVIYNVTGTVGTDARGVKPALAYSSNSITQDEIPTVPTLAILNFTFDPAVELEAGDYLFGAEKTSGAFSISVVEIDQTTPTHYGNGAWYVSGWGWDNETDTIFYLYGYYPEPTSSPITNLTYEAGETWISWTWDSEESTNVSIYHNDIYISNNSTPNLFGLTDLNRNEKHKISLILNETGETFESTAYTKKATFENNFIYLLAIAIVFWILGQKFQLFTWLSILIFFYGGITSFSQTTESWVILTFWLGGIISIFSLSLKGV